MFLSPPSENQDVSYPWEPDSGGRRTGGYRKDIKGYRPVALGRGDIVFSREGGGIQI